MFYKRLCDQWENEADEAIAEQERQQGRTFTERKKPFSARAASTAFPFRTAAVGATCSRRRPTSAKNSLTAMRAVSNANEELRGVFTVDWNQPAPDGSGNR